MQGYSPWLKEVLDAPTREDIRPKKRGDMFSHYEQKCPICGEWKPRFAGSRMYGTTRRSTFDRCRECRGAVNAAGAAV